MRKYINKLLNVTPYELVRRDVRRNAVNAALSYRIRLSKEIASNLGYHVQRGPFKGLKIQKGSKWSEGDLAAKILGSYERELFPAIELEIMRNPTCVVNVGCAEGYYSAGLSKRLPSALVFGVDIDERVKQDFADLNSDNNVLSKFMSYIDFGDLPSAISSSKTIFWMIDCEGFEQNLPKMDENVKNKSTFIIELHEVFVPEITSLITKWLMPSHKIQLINEVGRNLFEFPELEKYTDFEKSICLCEFRGQRMSWIYAVPIDS